MISQNSKIHRNSFEKGVNKDFNKSLLPSEQVIDSANISLVDNGTFMAAQNIKGTVNVQAITGDANARVLGVFESYYKIGTTEGLPCLTIFTATPSDTLNIYCYDTTNDTLYSLYEETIGADYLTNDRVIDGVLFSESNINTLYFTDNYNEIRKVRCEVPTVYTANFLTSFDLSVLRRGALGYVSISSISTGGALFTGTYQFVYQMLDPEKKIYSKWSVLSNPIHVYTTDKEAGIGLQSDKRLQLSVRPSVSEVTNYTHFRLAVLENIYPESQDNLALSVTESMEVADHLTYAGPTPILQNVFYSSNLQNNLLELSEVVIDHAPIKTAKTIEIKDNRLVLGNITYNELQYNNGNPSITGGSILKQNFNPESETDNTLYRGYFRGEVYRYAISYFDGNGNFSNPYPLDMSLVTGNQSTQTGFKDMKFPRRDQLVSATKYSILSGNTPVNLGLQITGLNNHPTWAKGFVILRRKRLKDIQWQSPLLPMVEFNAPGAFSNYPNTMRESSDNNALSLPNATPMGPITTYIAPNLFYPKHRKVSLQTTTTGSGVSKRLANEVYIESSSTQNMSMVFPPQTMYSENSKYSFNGSNKLQTVDAVKLNQIYKQFSAFVSEGLELDTNLTATFYGLRTNIYYYDEAHSGAKAALRSSLFKINGYKDFDNLSNGDSLNSKNLFKYEDLKTDGVGFEGATQPTTQRCGVVDLSDFTPINNSSTLVFADNGAPSAYSGATANTYESSGANYSTTQDGTTYINTVEIVNCVSGLSDGRYGTTTSQQEFIITANPVIFLDSELATVEAGGSLPKTVDIWGGDCIVSAHTFKITDSWFGFMNSTKHTGGTAVTQSTALDRWGKIWRNQVDSNQTVLSLPAPFKCSASFIQIYIESEYNGNITDVNLLTKKTGTSWTTGTYGVLNGVNYADDRSASLSPLTYLYNINLTKENNDKTFTLVDSTIPVVTRFGSRMVYSDVKVYQSQIEGFDIFRVLNFSDLLETYGDITKIIRVGDSLYALQERASTYIGVGERVLEQTDASTLAVRSNDFLGTMIVINSDRGCQHLKSAATDGQSLIFVDNLNKTVNLISDRTLNIISDAGLATEFRNQFTTMLPEYQLVTVYDPVKKEYLVGKSNGDFCWVFNTDLGVWATNIKFANNNFMGGDYVNQKLYIVGRGVDNNQISIHEMYTGPTTYLMGTYVVPYVKLVINPDAEISKTFDDILLNASDRLDTIDMVVNRETLLGDQTITGMDIDVSSRGEGNFKIKVLRDASDRRLRGLNTIMTINWKTGASEQQVNLASVLTKYRLSENIF